MVHCKVQFRANKRSLNVRDHQKITSIRLNRFCMLNKPPQPPVRNRQCQTRWYTNQNQVKNTCPFYIVFKVLKVLLIKIYKTQPPAILFLFVSNQLFHQEISFFIIFQIFNQHYLKKDFHHIFSFFNKFTPTPHPLNSQNLLSMTKVFC